MHLRQSIFLKFSRGGGMPPDPPSYGRTLHGPTMRCLPWFSTYIILPPLAKISGWNTGCLTCSFKITTKIPNHKCLSSWLSVFLNNKTSHLWKLQSFRLIIAERLSTRHLILLHARPRLYIYIYPSRFGSWGAPRKNLSTCYIVHAYYLHT